MILNLNRSYGGITEMKVRCITNNGKELSQKVVEAGHLTTTEYQLNIGYEYTVYGISIWKNVLHYLTMDKYETFPTWHPAELFIVSYNMLPFEWYFKYFNVKENEDLNAIWGYRELVLEEYHYDELLERDDKAIRVFLKRKKEMEEN